MALKIASRPRSSFFITVEFGKSKITDWLKDRDDEIAYILRNPDGEMMVARKSYYPEGIIRFPTGGVEAGESPAEALVREVKEEMGIVVKNAKYVLRIDYRLSWTGCDKGFRTHCFVIDVDKARPRIVDEQNEHEAHEWITKKGLAELIGFFEGYEGEWKDYCRFRVVLHRAVLDKVLE